MRLTLADLAGARGRLLAALLVLLAPAGCSYRLSQPPPARPLQWEGECETSRFPVGGDIMGSVFTGSLALGSLAAAGSLTARASDETVPSWNPDPQTNDGVTTFLVIGALSTVATVALIRSAGYGLRSASACEAARAELVRRRMGWPPPAWTWPTPPPS